MDAGTATATAINLVEICHEAHKTSFALSKGCSGCVKYFAYRLGVYLPGVCNPTEESRANALVDYMKQNWTTITKEQALIHAQNGKLVVAGKAEPGKTGHVVVVLPELIEPLNKWGKGKQSLRCCSLTSGNYAGAISDADKTVFDAWGNEDGVEYWLAPSGKSACEGKPLGG